MSDRTATTTPIFDAILNARTSEDLAAIASGLTAEDARLVDDYVNREHGGSYSAALNVQDPDLAKQVDAIMGGASA